MGSQHFFLRWDNYQNHITYAFGTLRNQEDFVDVTLSCEGKKIRAHKVLLSACSSYFREVFKDNPCQHPVIVFKNVKYDDLLAIIEFMYQGEVNVLQESLPSFLNTADLLSVQGLTEGGSSNGGNNAAPTMSVSTILDTSGGTLLQQQGQTAQLITTQSVGMPQQVQSSQKSIIMKPQLTVMQPTERRFVKKVFQTQPTQQQQHLKSLSQPITLYSTTSPATKLSPVKKIPMKTPTLIQNVVTTHTSAAGHQTATLVASQPTMTTTLEGITLQGSGGGVVGGGQGQQLVTATTTTSSNSSGSGPTMSKRKRIVFDSDDNISIEGVNYVKQVDGSEYDMKIELPEYIEIRTTGDDGKTTMELTNVTADDLMSGAESDNQTQENVIIEEGTVQWMLGMRDCGWSC